MFSRTGPQAFKADLKNIQLLCARLGHPELKVPSIHIAGTNGKGSVSHMLAAVFQQHRYRTGLFTSPHLMDFRERIRINGQTIPEQEVVNFVEQIKEDTEDIQPSFFELSCAMALQHFAIQKVDIAIIETGLGGRLDSTNIVHSIFTIITQIGLDHMEILGDTLEKIAGEKAGIFKYGVSAVIGESNEETTHVFIDKARAIGAPLIFSEKIFEIKILSSNNGLLNLEATNKMTGNSESYRLDLLGHYQQQNLRSVLTAVELLREKFQLQPELVKEALAHTTALTGLRGRWERIATNPDVILDVAHNEDGIRQINCQLQLSDYDQLHIVFGMVRDKDVKRILSILPPKATYYFTKANLPRALGQSELKEMAQAYGLEGNAFPGVKEALDTALHQADESDLVLVCGSIFLVGEAMDYLDAAASTRVSGQISVQIGRR